MEFKQEKALKLKSPIMLAGAPGMGLVAKYTVDYFIKKLHAEEFGTLSSDYSARSVAVFDNRGILKLSHFNKQYRFYFLKTEPRDFVFFSADYQPITPENQNELSDAVAEVTKKLKVKRIYTTAAMPVREKVKNPKVFGAATTNKLMDFLTSKGILAAVLAVINKLSKLFEYEIDTDELKRELDRHELLYKKLEEEYKKAVAPKVRKEVPSYIGQGSFCYRVHYIKR